MKQNHTNSAKTQKQFVIILFLIVYCALIIPSTRDCFGQNITWQKVLNNNYGSIQKIQQTTDRGYIAVGSDRLNNQAKIYLTKLDSLGNVLWFKHIGLGENMGNWVEQTTDGGFIIGGATNLNIGNSRAYLIKTDDQGNITWEKTYSNSDLDQCYCVKQTSDGGYILSCRTAPNRNGIFLIKTNSSGIEEWRKIYYENTVSMFAEELEIFNNGFITAGRIIVDNQTDIFVMRLDNSGDSVWTKRLGGIQNDNGYSIDKIDENVFVIAGETRITLNRYESVLYKMDISGNVLWEKAYSSLGSESCYSVRYIPNSGFVIAGSRDSLGNDTARAYLRTLDLNGNILFSNSFLGSERGSIFYSVEETQDGGFIAAGLAILTGAFYKMFVVKADSKLNSTPIGIQNISTNLPAKFEVIQNYPNPFNPETNIEFNITERSEIRIEIFDVLGKQIDKLSYGILAAGSYVLKWNAGNKPSGVYFYKLVAGEFVDVKKMILLK